MSICSLPSLASSTSHLTQENLRRLSALNATHSDDHGRTELVRRYCASLNDLYSPRQRRYEETAAYIIRGPGGMVHLEHQIRRSATTCNIAIDAQPLPFPYHNDTIFLPANNADIELSQGNNLPGVKRSQSTLSSHRLSSDVWWQDISRSHSCSSYIPRGGSVTPLYLHTIDEDTVVSDNDYVSSIKNWNGFQGYPAEYVERYPAAICPFQPDCSSPPPPPPSTIAFHDAPSCFASLCKILKRLWRRKSRMRRG
ncbi:hypothetical protein BCR43DRAFT_513923 [Syncephalastrum racemosum]|uniref:Uncharacterized protein n=1 Tax=Syncephalastrum racemosum TaxID=13706 RepID=A0A1X2HF39_SYNRA|nr:hypothetical protein BCR43DRAFT_513923 [Syncephalastrum racemosum]